VGVDAQVGRVRRRAIQGVLEQLGPWRQQVQPLIGGGRERMPARPARHIGTIHQNIDLPQKPALRLVTALPLPQSQTAEGQYVPVRSLGFYQVQPEYLASEIKPICEILKIDPSEIRVNDELGNEYLADLKKEGIEFIDMRKTFREQSEPAFWKTDSHINTLGHRLIGEALLPHVEEMIEKKK